MLNRYIFIILLFILNKQVTAQNGFVMSSVGVFPSTSSNIAAMQFRSIASCIDVQTGIAVLKGDRGSGEFAINCEVTLKYNKLGIKMYPNPVQTAAKIKFINTPPLTETFNLSIWTTDGLLISTNKETGYNLTQGISIDLTNIHAGTYVLKIESSSYVDAIKFIKAN